MKNATVKYIRPLYFSKLWSTSGYNITQYIAFVQAQQMPHANHNRWHHVLSLEQVYTNNVFSCHFGDWCEFKHLSDSGNDT